MRLPSTILYTLLTLCILSAACASNGNKQAGKGDPSTKVAGSAAASYEENLGLYDIDKPSPQIADPLEGFNRTMYQVNDALYVNALKPLTVFYSRVVPGQVRQNVSNAYRNVGYPGRAVNSALQGKWEKVGQETENFVLNTTIGVGGLFRASDKFGSKVSPENTNQTLEAWGMGDGFFLFLPLFGPTTARGAVGAVGDHFLDPISYVEDDAARYGLTAEERVNALSLRLGDYESFKESALDPYTAIKDAYMQNMRKLEEE